MATVAMSAKRTAGEKSGPGAGHSGVERKRAAETDLEQVTALREVRKVAKLRGNDKSSNPDLKLPPSAFASVAREHRCSAADIAGLRCARKDLYDVIRGKTAGVRDGPCHPPDDRGHIIFEPERNLTPRFKMLTCVGTGTFGKVIMCWDRLEDRAVAVKVIRSEPKYAVAGQNEISVLITLMKHDTGGQRPFVRLRSWFEYKGGVGGLKHIVMVFDMLGPSLYDTMLRNHSLPFHIRDIRGYVRQILESLAYMHGLGIVHTDIKPENLLHTKAAYVKRDVRRVGVCASNGASNGASDGASNGASDGASNAGGGGDGGGERAPKRVALSADRKPADRKPLAAYQPSDGKVIMCDFGSAAFEDGVHARTVSTRNYRAPEIILQVGWSLEVDLWSVGCLIMEMVTGTTFFSTSCDREHLMMIKKVLGKDIPRGMVERHHAMVSHSEVLVANGSTVEPVPETGSLLSKKLLDRYFVLRVNQSMVASSQETKDLKSLVKTLLTWDPRDRATAKAALAHPFFTRSRGPHEG